MLQAHSEKSKQDLTAYEQFKDPQTVTVTTLTPNRKEIGKAFKKDGKVLARPVQSCTTHMRGTEHRSAQGSCMQHCGSASTQGSGGCAGKTTSWFIRCSMLGARDGD